MYSLENTRFFLEFTENNRIEIAEPTGFDGSHFTLLQDNGRMGRDVAFSGETLEFNPTVNIEGLTHQFDTLIQYYDNKGFESDILFIIEINGTDYVIGQLDFANAETDRIKYFRCSVIQETKQAVLKRHLTTKVDLYSNKDIYDNTITPLTPKKVLLNSLPLKQTSSWEKPADFNNNFIPPDPNLLTAHWNPFNAIISVGIENTLSPTTEVIYNSSGGDFYRGYEMLEAVNTLTNVQATLSGCYWNFAYFPTTAWVHNIWFAVGFDVNNITKEVSYSIPATANNYTSTFNVPPMERGEKLYVFIRFVMGFPTNQSLNVSITQGTLTIDTTSTAVSSVTDGIRLGDAFRQVIKSISGSSLNAPMFEASGDLYNQFIFQGNQLRQVKDKPFNMTLEKLLKYLPEINGDYEVTPDGNVFIGVEKDFYTNELCGSFIISPNATFRETFNDKYKVNKLEFKYSKYEDGNNEEEADSLLSVHTEAQYLIQNNQVENTKNIQVDFVRCAYLLEKTRKRNVLVTNNAAKSEDDTTFILDCIAATETSIQTFVLRHFIDDNNLLKLTNDGTFDFTTIGLVGAIVGGSTVFITEGENQGAYTCYEVTTYYIVLGKTDAPPADFTGISLTTIVFTPNAQFKAKTDQDITYTGIGFPTANMRFNIRQNVLYYYNQYLWTAHKYNNAEIMKTSFFKNGSTVYIRYNPEPIGSGFMNQDVERNRFAQGLVTPKIIETEVITDFSKFWECMTNIREKRGYVEIEDTDGSIKKIFPIEMNYNWKDFLLTIKGEEKWK